MRFGFSILSPRRGIEGASIGPHPWRFSFIRVSCLVDEPLKGAPRGPLFLPIFYRLFPPPQLSPHGTHPFYF